MYSAQPFCHGRHAPGIPRRTKEAVLFCCCCWLLHIRGPTGGALSPPHLRPSSHVTPPPLGLYEIPRKPSGRRPQEHTRPRTACTPAAPVTSDMVVPRAYKPAVEKSSVEEEERRGRSTRGANSLCRSETELHHVLLVDFLLSQRASSIHRPTSPPTNHRTPTSYIHLGIAYTHSRRGLWHARDHTRVKRNRQMERTDAIK